jgi:uncharacterized protein YjbJ (UPF0337 family)
MAAPDSASSSCLPRFDQISGTPIATVLPLNFPRVWREKRPIPDIQTKGYAKMITRQELEGKWKELKGQIREQWGELSDDELQRAKGDAEQLIGVIQQKTGQSRREIEAALQQMVHDGQSAVQQAAATARQYVESANRSLRDGYRQVEDQVEATYDEAKQMVRSRPLEAVIAAFGAGMICGVVVSLLMNSDRA